MNQRSEKIQHLVSGQLQKQVTLMSPKSEPAIWSRDTGQWILWYDSCQLNITCMSIYQRYMLPSKTAWLGISCGWPPCCAASSSSFAVHAASYFDHKKRAAWVPISMHTCGYGAPLLWQANQRNKLDIWGLENTPRDSYYAVISVSVTQQDRDENLWPETVLELLYPSIQTVQL